MVISLVQLILFKGLVRDRIDVLAYHVGFYKATPPLNEKLIARLTAELEEIKVLSELLEKMINNE
jgi:hypothetical protein